MPVPVGRLPEPPDPEVKNGLGERGGEGCRGPDGGCGKSRKTASQRQAWCYVMEGETGEVLGATTVKSGGVRELGSSSTANPGLAC